MQLKPTKKKDFQNAFFSLKLKKKLQMNDYETKKSPKLFFFKNKHKNVKIKIKMMRSKKFLTLQRFNHVT